MTVFGVHDHRGHALVEVPLRPGLARPRLAREQIVGRQHDRPGGKQVTVKPLQREPLEVDDIGAPREPSVARHVRDVPASSFKISRGVSRRIPREPRR